MSDGELEFHIRRQHAQRRYQIAQSQLLQQELDLEDELLNEYPEMTEFIYQINQAEIARQQQGFGEEIQTDLKMGRRTGFINRLFPGIE